MPVPEPTAPSAGSRRECRLVSADHIVVLDLHRSGVVEPRVVAFGRDGDGEVDRARGIDLELDTAGRVVDAAELQR